MYSLSYPNLVEHVSAGRCPYLWGMHSDLVVALPVRPVSCHRIGNRVELCDSLANCGHTFCQDCLTSWFDTTQNQRSENGLPTYSCPSCRHPVHSPPVQNFSLKRLAAESRGGESSLQRPPPVWPPSGEYYGGVGPLGPFNGFFGPAPLW